MPENEPVTRTEYTDEIQTVVIWRKGPWFIRETTSPFHPPTQASNYRSAMNDPRPPAAILQDAKI